MNIVGYADKLSVQEGDDIRFMISSVAPSYQATIVRLIHGDPNPNGPGYKQEQITSTVDGVHEGRRQPLRSGSHIIIPNYPMLSPHAGITIQLWMMPTTPQIGRQALLAKTSPDGSGFGLYINDTGAVEFVVAQGDASDVVATSRPLYSAMWYFVTAICDPLSQEIRLTVQPRDSGPVDDTECLLTTETATRPLNLGEIPNVSEPLLIAGAWDLDEDGSFVGCHYNGKIDAPRLYERALDQAELATLHGDDSTPKGHGLLAAWDFSLRVSSHTVVDTSGHNLHGVAVNMPTRAVTGFNWRGREVNYNNVPREYGAIHFHRDDLADACWKPDIVWQIPADLKSGVYALHVKSADGEDHIPFFVRPGPNSSKSKIALLIPTFSYLAYANEQMLKDEEVKERYESLGGPIEYPANPSDRYIVEHGLLSCYDLHEDGSGVCYSSFLRPVLNMRPQYHMPLLGFGRGAPHQLSADLHIVDWLYELEYEFDIITDHDLHAEGSELLEPYQVVLTGSHPEYWSQQMLDGLEGYLGGGGKLMYLGGNGFYWVTQLDKERGHAIELRRWGASTRSWDAEPGEWYLSSSGELGGLWRFRGRAPQRLLGIGFSAQGFDRGRPYVRGAGSFEQRVEFIFKGIEPDEVIGDFPNLVLDWGAAGFELDRLDERLGSPPHTILLATASGYSDAYQHVVDDVLTSTSTQSGTVDPDNKADMAFLEYPSGGAVFSTGSISWCGALSYNGYDNNVSRITRNVLDRFSSTTPL